MSMVELYEGALDVPEIITRWYAQETAYNYGAYIPFIGTVRDEEGIEGLSFDIYAPILTTWFQTWQTKAAALGAKLKMAHSRGDVLLHESSYIAAVFSPKRRVALELIEAFVEDFKASAPIWKYDLKNGQRRYAAERSTRIAGAGILGGNVK